MEEHELGQNIIIYNNTEPTLACTLGVSDLGLSMHQYIEINRIHAPIC